jgi:hypothetical protein
VPTGRLFSALESTKKLATAAETPMTLGQNRVKPPVCFSAIAQTISNRPAPRRMVQGMAASSSLDDRALSRAGVPATRHESNPVGNLTRGMTSASGHAATLPEASGGICLPP